MIRLDFYPIRHFLPLLSITPYRSTEPVSWKRCIVSEVHEDQERHRNTVIHSYEEVCITLHRHGQSRGRKKGDGDRSLLYHIFVRVKRVWVIQVQT